MHLLNLICHVGDLNALVPIILVEGHCHVENKTEHSNCPSIGVNGNKHVILAVLEMKKNESVKKTMVPKKEGWIKNI